MGEHLVKIKMMEHETHNVLRIQTEKPKDMDFVPGQATEVSIDKTGWENEGRPFTFTSLPNQDFLEFIIKIYPDHKGVTHELLKLKIGDRLILNDIFGAINYKGKGTFIAGGAGITPFVSIFRDLRAKGELGNNKLIFANKNKADIILEKEFRAMLGNNFINILSNEKVEDYAHGSITQDFIKNNSTKLNSYFYVCGPPPMMKAIDKQLTNLKIPKKLIVTEEF